MPDDVRAVRAFGAAVVPVHYAPLIGDAAAAEQLRAWWGHDHLAAAVAQGVVLVAETPSGLAGVAQHGRVGDDHVVWKLYVAPEHRGRGLGPCLLDAVTRRLPSDADRLWIEHVAANERAAAFYAREGFAVDRVEPHPGGDPRLATVWRSRPLRRA